MKFAVNKIALLLVVSLVGLHCKKNENEPPPQGESLVFSSATVDEVSNGLVYTGTSTRPVIRLAFDKAVEQSSMAGAISLTDNAGVAVPFDPALEAGKTVIAVHPSEALKGFTSYSLTVSNSLSSETGARLLGQFTIALTTGIDSTDKFPRISDEELLTLVQKQTFKYFWDFAHPVSGLARERNSSGDLVTSGGSGFGIMAIVTGVHRQFITRSEGLAQMQKIVGFLKNTAKTFHGAYPHWLNGTTGQAIAFSEKDDGADLVETSFLMQGLLTARQFFDGAGAGEATLRADINEIWNRVEWNWFRNGNQDVLYWHWSENYNFEMDHRIQGWNECLITYVLAAASPGFSIPKSVYDNGWARNGSMRNNGNYFGTVLPLGPAYGGPLFFSHYSFLGLNPNNLNDAYAGYRDQNVAHATINYNYCVNNPKGYYGYSNSVWGLTASDNNKSGYSAHSPDNDLGIITPTAALSSLPYTPEQSMNALRFFYYKLGDKIWSEYGFIDAFNLTDAWFATSFLAIDQGPIIIMIENHRTGLLWDLFMSCPEVKSGLQKLSFQSPNI